MRFTSRHARYRCSKRGTSDPVDCLGGERGDFVGADFGHARAVELALDVARDPVGVVGRQSCCENGACHDPAREGQVEADPVADAYVRRA